MAWDAESVLSAGATVGYGGTLWILYLAGNTDVGVGKTSDYYTQKSSVKSYAKSHGLAEPSDPTVREGYRNISRKTVVDAEGNAGPINNQHKPDILSLTSLGKGLMSKIHHDQRIELALQESIGIETDDDPDPWWPGDGPNESMAIFLRTFADRSVLDEEEAEFEAIATFDCLRCDAEIEHRYEVTITNGYIVEGWSRTVTVECSGCGLVHEHCPVDPQRPPDTCN